MREMKDLKTLSKAVHEHSGIDNPVEGWMTLVFGQWKGFVLSIMVSLATFLAITVTCGYCCVPSIRALVVCLINRGIMDPVPEGQGPMMPLLAGDPEEEHLRDVLMTEIWD